ncbi:Transposable element Tcb2 transposase [Labeo rohita]|uniref:Transposable element Tcb2 transposase n=1 Tax=Labeo rohita TaxID=84645 RepID=A0ABQ8M2M9_LABRO|nr:Transposable element Tcb2 transposase [Labeo rohita]
MVSQFGSLGYTITGKTADLTVVQKTIIDTLHKEGKPQTFIAKEAGCSQSAPLLNHRRCQRRLTWAKEKKKWTVAQWSDESKFCISFGNQGPRVWRKGGEAHSPSCLKSSVKFPQSVMIWAAMSSAGVGPLCFLKTKVTAPFYQEMLEHFMLPSADQLFKDADFIFQQDLAPAHTAKSTKNELKATVKETWASIPPQLSQTDHLHAMPN